MLKLFAFLFAVTILVGVHEWGHFIVARWCGVRVLRFSIGLGKPLFRWQASPDTTEYVIAMLPLGGYVRMLDSTVASVAESEKPFAFDQKTLWQKTAIVLAGPLANLLLAVILFGLMALNGRDLPEPVVAASPASSLAAQAGIPAKARILTLTLHDHEDPAAYSTFSIEHFEQLHQRLTEAVLAKVDVHVQYQPADNDTIHEAILPIKTWQTNEQAADSHQPSIMWQQLGLGEPWSSTLVTEVIQGGPAELGGLRVGDQLLTIQGQTVQDGSHARRLIRQSLQPNGHPVPLTMQVMRDQQTITLLTLQPILKNEPTGSVPRIQAMIGSPPAMVHVKHSPWQALMVGVDQVWTISVLSIKTLGKMLIGEASLKHLTGPFTMAEYAGETAKIGLISYIPYLALISVSLGVMNLLPIPTLDGGHLMFYLSEALMKRPLNERIVHRLTQFGLYVLLLMMSIALFNDFMRLFH